MSDRKGQRHLDDRAHYVAAGQADRVGPTASSNPKVGGVAPAASSNPEADGVERTVSSNPMQALLAVLRHCLATVWIEAEPGPVGWPASAAPQVRELEALRIAQQRAEVTARRPGTGPSTVVLNPQVESEFAVALALGSHARAVEAISTAGVLVLTRGRFDDALRLRLTAAEHHALVMRPEPVLLLPGHPPRSPRPPRPPRSVREVLRDLALAFALGGFGVAGLTRHLPPVFDSPGQAGPGAWIQVIVSALALGTAAMLLAEVLPRIVQELRRLTGTVGR